jgi:hypothetical protein
LKADTRQAQPDASPTPNAPNPKALPPHTHTLPHTPAPQSPTEGASSYAAFHFVDTSEPGKSMRLGDERFKKHRRAGPGEGGVVTAEREGGPRRG